MFNISHETFTVRRMVMKLRRFLPKLNFKCIHALSPLLCLLSPLAAFGEYHLECEKALDKLVKYKDFGGYSEYDYAITKEARKETENYIECLLNKTKKLTEIDKSVNFSECNNLKIKFKKAVKVYNDYRKIRDLQIKTMKDSFELANKYCTREYIKYRLGIMQEDL
jgi:hypothetical protein